MGPHSIRNFSNKDRSEIYAIKYNKPIFDLFLDLINRSSIANREEILIQNYIRNNYYNTIYSGKLDSAFYSTFIDNLIIT